MRQHNKFVAAMGTLLIVTACSVETEGQAADQIDTVPIEEVDATASDAEQQSTREELREKAETDPEGADAEAIGNMSRNEVVATAINSAGFLCASVTDLYPTGGAMVADCVENRNGSGRAQYRIDTATMSVEQME